MPNIEDVVQYLERFAPPELAAEWDNVGLLMGDRRAPVSRMMTCLTVTSASAAEAIRERVELIVTHHPLPFRPVRRITADTADGKLLWELARNGVAIYSPHTAFDSASDGINQRLAAGMGLVEVRPLIAPDGASSADGAGTGRVGKLSTPCSLRELVAGIKQLLQLSHVQIVGSAEQIVSRVGIACGSAGELLADAARAGCDCFVTGEMRFHSCLEAETLGIAAVLAGHFGSERIGVEGLAAHLAQQFPSLSIWASRDESDPLTTL